MPTSTDGNRDAVKVVTAVVVAVLALGACESGSGSGQPKADGDRGAAVVAPGKPGEPARTLSPEEAAKELPDDSPNAADVGYVQMMIVHHQQALEMTALVPDRAAGTPVKRLADRIRAAQQPEIGAMRGWLKRHGKGEATGGHGSHDHGAMPGMATDEQLARLRAAEGRAFDELFLELMITHHQGALTMGATVLSEGNNVQVGEMANDVIAQQTAEISRMRTM
ncbi:DUF305 domain-containing protein [Streptomyces tirandamycinicus]|uniref:DUF305 domain-containing protein n=1 Tax=Streptomyces TaxID=1883 RepID=UPI001BB1DD24|nr:MULTISPECIES: DUF305 domain-containing protein [Streptomyces]MCY0984221.1 DUF305 domain-containing protein [Streptomyces tirandamycinicus]